MSPANELAFERVGSTLVVEPGRQIDAFAGCNHAEIRQQLIDQIRKSKSDAVIVDFRQVECVGSYLLDTLCVAWRSLPASSRRLSLCNVTPMAHQVLKVSRLDGMWPIFKSREEALKAHTKVTQSNVMEGDTVFMPVPGSDRKNRLRIIERGQRTVVGFDGGELPPEHAVGRYLSEIQEIVADHGCRDLKFDLSGQPSIPSGLLGVMATLSKQGVHVSIRHPSPAVREIFQLANLDHVLRSSLMDSTKPAVAESKPDNSKSSHAATESAATSKNTSPAPANAVTAQASDAKAPPKPDWMGSLFAIDRAPNTLIVSLTITGTVRATQLIAEADALRRKLADPAVKHLVLDLNGVSFVGSEVIGVLVGLANDVKAAGGKAAVCRVSMHVREMLLSVGLLRMWPQCPSREAAVIAVNRP